MKRIKRVFEDLRKRKRKALIPYVTAGDPSVEKTFDLLGFFAEKGADIIELGVPFSDPMADGPTIQRAMERALKTGTNLREILDVVKEFRKKYGTPIVLMGYMNPFFSYGLKNLAEDAMNAGVDAILTVDLPPEEAKEFHSLLIEKEIGSIFLATPLTDQKRIRRITKYATGFIYFVSVTGVTGEREKLPKDIVQTIGVIKSCSKLPLVLGFGISGKKTIEEFYDHVDGFVVGSALIKRWEASSFNHEEPSFREFFFELLSACHGQKTNFTI